MAAAEGKVDIKRFGLLPKEFEANKLLSNGDAKERKSILYLTNRKKAYGTWDWLMDTFCCCCPRGEDDEN